MGLLHNNARACKHHTHALCIQQSMVKHSYRMGRLLAGVMYNTLLLCIHVLQDNNSAGAHAFSVFCLLSYSCRLSKQGRRTTFRVSKSHRQVAHMLKVVHKGTVAVVHSVLESVLRSVCASRLLCKEASGILWGSRVLLGMCRFSGNCGCS